MSQVMLTTIDNPFDPFTQFDEWYAYDEEKGYHTCGLLARIAKTSNELSLAEEEIIVRRAIDEIVRLNFIGLYKKVSRADPELKEAT